MEYYKDKIVWITGASSGLGEALAKEFSTRGAKIILSGRNIDSLSNVQHKIPNSKIVTFDISDKEVLQSKTNEAINAFGHIDIIVHNAGIAQNSAVIDIENQVEDKILQTNYQSPIELTKYLLPHFIERKQGYIVAVSGLLAYLNLPERSTYAASKAALNAYFGCLRGEVKDLGINVAVVVPGSLSTELTNKAMVKDGTTVIAKKEVKGYPLDKAVRRIADAVLKRKFQIYVGSRKEFIMWKMWGLYPNFIIKKILAKMS